MKFRFSYLFLFLLLMSCGSTYLWDNLQKKAPEATANDVNGTSVSIPVKSKATVLHFWAYNHPLSRNSLTYMNKLNENVAKKGGKLVVVCLNWSGSEFEVKDYLSKNGYNFTVVFDQDGSIGKKYEVTSIPQTQVIQSNGTITHRLMGLREDVDYPSEIAGKIGAN
ncbi:TlpA family protein disulfide reductase [bacterium]|nr:MAG: TlpA family protein disulfide reductase [bacterium]